MIAIELFARFYLGLGCPPLYIEDKDYEYIYAPNQHVKRFGNRIITNEFSMRSKPLSKNDKIRILKIGDSIINGGAQTDQDSLASSILESRLSASFHDSIRVLNVGANSWGPDNAFAYIKKNGHFDASMIVLVFSSHDLHDLMHFQKVVGKYTAWPDKKPFCALSDGFFKYFMPLMKSKLIENYNEYDEFESLKLANEINPGWESFFNYSKEHTIELLVYLHPTKQEVLSAEYDKNGKQLIQMFEANHIGYILGLNSKMDESCYRDFIHLNNKGQKKLASALYNALSKQIENKLNAQ
ncbi:MAG: hypothetical protein JNL69_07710 [Bacteroidia bacterium]|nr:hypothetical protein [Bacteroidia bacterium]